MTYDSVGEMALCAATAIDAAARGAKVDLAHCARLADALVAMLGDPAPRTILDLRDALRPGDESIAVVADVERAVREEADVLRAAATDPAPMRDRAVATCLSLHRTLLARSDRGIGPFGLAA